MGRRDGQLTRCRYCLQLGVRTFIGSIGPVNDVRMMVSRTKLLDAGYGGRQPSRDGTERASPPSQMKSGHRACYMSRAFAQQHGFIPKDAAPGFYGFSGITNLGTWPIKVSHCPSLAWARTVREWRG